MEQSEKSKANRVNSVNRVIDSDGAILPHELVQLESRSHGCWRADSAARRGARLKACWRLGAARSRARGPDELLTVRQCIDVLGIDVLAERGRRAVTVLLLCSVGRRDILMSDRNV